MSEIRRALKFEFEKLRHNKIFPIMLAVLLSIAILFPSVQYFLFEPLQSMPVPDREAILSQYAADLAAYEKFLANDENNLTESERESAIELCKRYRFFLETGTVESDYLNSRPLGNRTEKRENAGFMFYFGTVSAFFLWAIAIVTASYLFLFEYHTHTMKNIFASQISRKKIYLAKLTFLLLFTIAVFLLFTVFALFFGLSQTRIRLLIFHNHEYRSIGVISAFLTQAVATFTIMLVFCSVTVLSGITVRNLVVGLAAPALFYAFSMLMTFSYEIFSTLNPMLQKKDLFNKLPILSLQFHVGGFDWAFLVSLVLHLFFTVLTLFFANRILKKQVF